MAQTYIPAALRRFVRERGLGCCEYCVIPEQFTLVPHWVDHIVAEKHGGQTTAENLALACVLCNLFKGSDLTSLDPESGEITPLFHPRQDRWSDHFRLDGAIIEPLTPTGRVTVRLLQLNKPDRIEERNLLVRLGVLSPNHPGAPGPPSAST